MRAAFAGMSFSEITAARQALFATGSMRLVNGQMQGGPLADLYNRLAAVHGKAR